MKIIHAIQETNGETDWKDYCGLKCGASDYGVRGDHVNADAAVVAAAAGDDDDDGGGVAVGVAEMSVSDDDRVVSVHDDAHADAHGEVEVKIDASMIRVYSHHHCPSRYRVSC